MIVQQNQMMLAEAEILLFDVSTPSPSPVFADVHASDTLSIEISSSESVLRCSSTVIESSPKKFVPSIRSGSHTDTGPRKSNEDEHIRIDDLPAHLGSLYRWSLPSSFYAVFDGHGGSGAATYIKNNATRLFFEEADLPKASDIDDAFMQDLQNSHRKAFLLADQALADDISVDQSCGTTALTALVLGKHLMVANAGDCRAVLCRKGVAVQMSQDHRPSYLSEQKRVEDLGGYFEYGYLNGELAVTRALGDWYMKLPFGSESPLTAEPDIQQIVLTEEDEFLIIGCDGIWDVMSNQEAVSLVRRGLMNHDDPQQCARELVNQALRLDTSDNLTVIVVCFSACRDKKPSVRPRLRCCSLSEDARAKLRSLLEGN
ncbi:hypothetical protein LguiA_000940 [Lonicera macranthoides]